MKGFFLPRGRRESNVFKRLLSLCPLGLCSPVLVPSSPRPRRKDIESTFVPPPHRYTLLERKQFILFLQATDSTSFNPCDLPSLSLPRRSVSRSTTDLVGLGLLLSLEKRHQPQNQRKWNVESAQRAFLFPSPHPDALPPPSLPSPLSLFSLPLLPTLPHLLLSPFHASQPKNLPLTGTTAPNFSALFLFFSSSAGSTSFFGAAATTTGAAAAATVVGLVGTTVLDLGPGGRTAVAFRGGVGSDFST